MTSVSARWPALSPGHDRFDCRPISQRPDYHWPGGARLAVCLGFNLEHFAFGDGLGACLGPPSPQPDVLNYSWREYGNRVGAWGCLELFDALGLPAAALVMGIALHPYIVGQPYRLRQLRLALAHLARQTAAGPSDRTPRRA
jgi:hypothetical protein